MAKKTQKAVNYREGTPEGSCAACVNFVDPESCTQVQGTIGAGGLCDLFTPPQQTDTASLEQMLFGGGMPQ